MRDLTSAEQAVLDKLGEAANLHGQLAEVHPSDSPEFCHAVHQAQNIVLARPAVEVQKPLAVAAEAECPPPVF